MSFVNQNSCLLTDSIGNIYNFLWAEEKINLIYFDRSLQKVNKSTIIEDCTEEFDVTIDKKDRIFLVCNKNNGSLIFLTKAFGSWSEELILEELNTKIYNLNIKLHDFKKHIVFCIPSNESNYVYQIYHYYYEKEKWNYNIIGNISRKEVLNPFQLINLDESLYIFYYDLVKDIEQVFFKKYDLNSNTWLDEIKLTDTNNSKMYLDTIYSNGELNLVYSEMKEGNLVIQYKKYEDIKEPKEIDSYELSNKANCSYPTLILYESRLWVVWTEYENIMSSYSDDDGKTWNGPFLWSESKKSDVLRYKFNTNDKEIIISHNLNYSFGKAYPDLSFIGFGDIKNAVKTPIKKKDGRKEEVKISTNKTQSKPEYKKINIEEMKEKIDDYNRRLKILEDYFKEAENLKKWLEGNYKSETLKKLGQRVSTLEENIGNDKIPNKDNKKLENLEERVEEIEEFLKRRRRPLFGQRRE
ncbi:MAG: hypothetical protein FH753_02195 [Firmicutes bacterium]|nr:hypothetical protein [Bacillota bacterium]